MVQVSGDKIEVNGKLLTKEQAVDLYAYSSSAEGKAIIKMVTPASRGLSSDKMIAIQNRISSIGAKISAERVKKCRIIPKHNGDDVVGFKAVLVVRFGEESQEFSFSADSVSHPSESVEERRLICDQFINKKLLSI